MTNRDRATITALKIALEQAADLLHVLTLDSPSVVGPEIDWEALPVDPTAAGGDA